jgi:hypothetical protein
MQVLDAKLDALPVSRGEINMIMNAITDAGCTVIAKKDVPPSGPLDGLGLGKMWRPTPSSWRWAKIDTGGDILKVLIMGNGGGINGYSLTHEQMVDFVGDAEDQVEKPDNERVRAVKRSLQAPVKKIHVPGQRG